MENNKLDFSNQDFHLGIDVHKKTWQVGIMCHDNLLKKIFDGP